MARKQLMGISPELHASIKNYLSNQPYNEVKSMMILLENKTVGISVEESDIKEAEEIQEAEEVKDELRENHKGDPKKEK